MLRLSKQMNLHSTDTLIGEGTVVEGSITSAAGLRIEGHVHGEIHCSGDVTIGEKGLVHCDINARNIMNGGTIHGAVSTRGKLTITQTGKVQGSISVASLAIAEGGLFQGTSRMEAKQEQTPDKNGNPIPLKQKEGKEQKDKATAAG